MRELSHNEPFSGSNESRSLVLVTGGATINIELDINGTFTDMGTYSENQVLDIDLKRGMNWRLSMSDSGASAKAYLSNPR